MKKSIYLMTVVALLLFVWSTSSLAADKIGFINSRDIMQTSNAGKKAAEDFKKYVDKESQEVKNMEKELKKMKEELEKQSSIMTQSSRSEKEAAYQKKLRDFQLLVNDTNEELKKRDQEIASKLIPKLEIAVRTVAEREKFTLVLDVATVAFYAKENDISKKVVEELNKMK